MREQILEARRKEMDLKYAEATRLYAETTMPLKEIAQRCGFTRGALGQYLRRYKRELVLRRYGVEAEDGNMHDVKIKQAGKQAAKTHEKYKYAVAACDSMAYIDYNVSQIARQFNVTPTGLANFMRIHYEDIIPRREAIRQRLGIADNTHRGASTSTVKIYSKAVEMYRTTDMTLPEIATECKVSERGLSQHLRFYHKDILREKDRQRKEAMSIKKKPKGALLGNGRKNRPSPKIVMKYAAALALYKSTDMLMKDIVARTGVPSEGFRFYLHKWHKPLVLERLGINNCTEDNEPADLRKARVKMKSVAAKYAEAIESLRKSPRPVAEVARKYGHNTQVFREYLHKHEPELAATLGMTIDSKGHYTSINAKKKYDEVINLYATTSEPLKSITKRLGINATSAYGYIRRHYPEIVLKHSNVERTT